MPWDTVEVAEERGFEGSPESQMIFRSSYLATISWGEESCAKKKKLVKLQSCREQRRVALFCDLVQFNPGWKKVSVSLQWELSGVVPYL